MQIKDDLMHAVEAVSATSHSGQVKTFMATLKRALSSVPIVNGSANGSANGSTNGSSNGSEQDGASTWEALSQLLRRLPCKVTRVCCG